MTEGEFNISPFRERSNLVPSYLHTLRHLKPRQMAFQVIRRFLRPPLPKRRGPVSLRSGVCISPVIPRVMPLADEFAFRFLSEERRFSPEALDWQPANTVKLWRYNLHYFDYLHEAGRSKESIRTLIDSWIAANAPGTVDAWEPFPLSLRIVNWIKHFLALGKQATIAVPWLDSLYDQTLWREQSIEYHLLANHYFKNGKALIFAGLYFAGSDADRWLRKGVKIVSGELVEQILPDGGHFERSPMYHAMILEDCLDLLNMGMGAGVRGLDNLTDRVREKCRNMIRYMRGMSHPDGQIALFNDAAFGIEATPSELAEYYELLVGKKAPEPEGTGWSFPDSGYFVMAPRVGDRLIIDCGPIGPDYQPGHAHCDMLSFELSLGGRRVIVDSGCSQYLAGELRTYQRGNAGHNTVTVDNLDQSEVWGAHRCARRARPLSPSLESLANGAQRFVGGHDGYRRLPGTPLHRRMVTWHGRTIRIEDEISGTGRHMLESRLHLHPDCRLKHNGDLFTISLDGINVAQIRQIGFGSLDVREGSYSQEFGICQPCAVITTVASDVNLPHKSGWIIELDEGS
jgi:uncharacterized heparinase superfamily protein